MQGLLWVFEMVSMLYTTGQSSAYGKYQYGFRYTNMIRERERERFCGFVLLDSQSLMAGPLAILTVAIGSQLTKEGQCHNTCDSG